jgi:hypothetical protein
MGNVSAVVNDIITVLKANVTDPVPERREQGQDWIFTDTPKISNYYPVIYVNFVSGSLSGLCIGTTHQRQRARIQVTVIAQGNQTFSISGTDYNPDELAEYLANEVIKAITGNQSSFSSHAWNVMPDNQVATAEGGFNYNIVDLVALMERGD